MRVLRVVTVVEESFVSGAPICKVLLLPFYDGLLMVLGVRLATKNAYWSAIYLIELSALRSKM